MRDDLPWFPTPSEAFGKNDLPGQNEFPQVPKPPSQRFRSRPGTPGAPETGQYTRGETYAPSMNSQQPRRAYEASEASYKQTRKTVPGYGNAQPSQPSGQPNGQPVSAHKMVPQLSTQSLQQQQQQQMMQEQQYTRQRVPRVVPPPQQQQQQQYGHPQYNPEQGQYANSHTQIQPPQPPQPPPGAYNSSQDPNYGDMRGYDAQPVKQRPASGPEPMYSQQQYNAPYNSNQDLRNPPANPGYRSASGSSVNTPIPKTRTPVQSNSGRSTPSASAAGASSSSVPNSGSAQQFSGNATPRSTSEPPGSALKDLRTLFDEVDRKKRGYLTERELSKALVNGDYTLFDAHTVRLMMKMFDRDGDGAIYFAEFGQLWKYLHEWRLVFQKFDTNNNENISLEEFSRALEAFGYTLSESCVLFMFNAGSKLNRQGERQMAFDMFVQSCISIKSITDTFKRYDSNRDGYVTMAFEDFLIETTKLH